MRIFHSLGHVFGGSLLVAGTTIGVGMLALPVATGPAGFFPSFIVYILCWLFMLCTGFLIIEVNLSTPNAPGFISMATQILGPIGKIFSWIAYLFLFLTVMIAHVAGGGDILLQIPNWPLSPMTSAILYTGALVPIIYLGTQWVDRINMLLISGVVLFYLGFVAVSATSIQPNFLTYTNWSKAWIGIPILIAAFTYQIIIPTLMTYLNNDVKKTRLSLVIGASIPLVVYLIWEILILGIIPFEGVHGLKEAAELGQSAVAPLKHYVQSEWITTFSTWFSFFALTTSFVPLALSFFDFLADGLKWEKKGAKRLYLCLAVFGIPLLIAIYYPHIFLVALGYAGGVSCGFLFGLLPPVMAYVCRYVHHCPQEYRQLPGGKPFLIFLMIASLFILSSQILQQIL